MYCTHTHVLQTYERTTDSALKVYLNGRMQLINDYADLPMVPPPLNLVVFPSEFLAAIVNHIRYGDSRIISRLKHEIDSELALRLSEVRATS